jgi:hypothetical protein
VFGPRDLERGHLAYNTAVKSAADTELLLNMVRLRYLDTLDFMATSSISSQLSISVSAGARGGSDTLAGGTGAIGQASVGYSTRPTFTFTPQRGREFALQLLEPVQVDLLTYLVASDWDLRMLLRLFARRLNDLDNELGMANRKFVEATDRLGALQAENRIFVGFVDEVETLSDPIPATRVSGADLVEAARSGLAFREDPQRGVFVLTASRSQPVVAFEEGSEDADAVLRLLGLVPGRPLYELESGTRLGGTRSGRETVVVRTGSLLRALIYLSQGIAVPDEHVQEGLTSSEWPPGSSGRSIEDIFHVRFAQREPDARLAVKHRGVWFYVPDDDLDSRYTFFHLAELFRLGMARGEGQAAPVLTLPVGGP